MDQRSQPWPASVADILPVSLIGGGNGLLTFHRQRPWHAAICRILVLATVLLGMGWSASAGLNPFLKTCGQDILNDYGQGDVVPLRGVNLGSWLLMESWMCPMDSSGNLHDDWSVRETLTQRFGAATKDSLLDAYEDAWLQAADFDNIAALGMNVVRLPFWYLNVEEEDGTWRADAFDRLDWAVSNAWERGIYTILDLHGAPGGQRANSDTPGRVWPTAGLWTSSTNKARMIEIWQRMSAHFSGNPAVAGYDLLNEPMDAPSMQAYWDLLNACYQTIRTNDLDHIIIMEATYWDWNLNMLPDPSTRGWSNVVYQLHVYPWNDWDNVDQLKVVAEGTVQDWVNHQSWNVPCHVGEFNMGAEEGWKYTIEKYSSSGMGWQMWSYKSTSGGGPSSWGVYNPNGNVTSVPNIQNHSANTIRSRWSQWTTSNAFSLNQSHKRTLAMPVAKDDAYTLGSGAVLNVPAPGVLGNDTHLNLGGAGIQLRALRMSEPVHGSLVLDTNGGFTYTANDGFSGSDSFRYKVWDGRIDSVRNATVSIQVVSNNTVGPVKQLIWSTQPDLATNGWPFTQQPVLFTADEFGNPATNGLPATLDVMIILGAGEGPLLGTTNINIGTAGENGVVHFTDLQINSNGADKQLTAQVNATTNTPSDNLLLNGDFNSPQSGAAPDNWTTWSYGGGWANHENKAGISFDGSYYMVNGGNANAGGGEFQILPAKAGDTYTLSVQSGADAWWLPYAEMRLFFLNADSQQLSEHSEPTVDPADYGLNYDIPHPWSNYTMTAIAPFGTTWIKVEFAEPNGTGSVWFENAVLTRMDKQPVLAAATTQPFTVHPAPPPTQTNYISGIYDDGEGMFTLQFVGTRGVQYYVQTTTDLAPPLVWESVAGSTNTVTNLDGSWLWPIANADRQRFYRSAVVNP